MEIALIIIMDKAVNVALLSLPLSLPFPLLPLSLPLLGYLQYFKLCLNWFQLLIKA